MAITRNNDNKNTAFSIIGTTNKNDQNTSLRKTSIWLMH